MSGSAGKYSVISNQRTSSKYVTSVQGSQGLQEEKTMSLKKVLGIPLTLMCHVLILTHFIIFCYQLIPTMYHYTGIYVTIIYSLIVVYLFISLYAALIKAQFTEAGFPERIATAVGHLKLNF